MLKNILLRIKTNKNNKVYKNINKNNKLEEINIIPYSIIDDSLLELKLEYYIIHLDRSTHRKTNINNLKNLLNQELIVFNAIDGNDIIDINDHKIIFNEIIIKAPFTFDKSIKTKLQSCEIGNYLSHLSLLHELIILNKNDGYSIIFEDDVIFMPNLDNKIRGILGKIKEDFDILYLGNITNNYSEQYIDEIYNVDKNNVLWGTHAYLINNKNLNKFYNHFNYFYTATDTLIKNLINCDKVKGYVIYPSIAMQNNKEYPSEIIRKNNKSLLTYLKIKRCKK